MLKRIYKKYFSSHRRKYLWVLAFIIMFSLGAITGYSYFQKTQSRNLTLTENAEKNVYVEFLSEIYDKIKEYYWDNVTDEQLSNLFKLGAEKLIGTPQKLDQKNKDGLRVMIIKIIDSLDNDRKKEFSTKLAQLVLLNLQPPQRSALYTLEDRENLKNRVQNVNPEANLYESLGVSKNASEKELGEAYGKKVAELEKSESLEAKKELEQAKYAYDVLSNQAKKERYDKAGIEPTVFAKLVRPNILHLYIKKISPTTFDELKKATEEKDNIDGLDTLILDLRANVGGSIDMLPYLLGPFIGDNQYAYEFLRKGEYTPYKTKIGWLPSLVRYKKVVILIDDKTQSSAEIMAATLKKYNAGITLGTTTRGWGTIEKVSDIEQQIDPNEKYSMLIVHDLTIRDDGQPIEGRGINPTISVNDPGWEKQLFAYFRYDELIKAVKEIWSKTPGEI